MISGALYALVVTWPESLRLLPEFTLSRTELKAAAISLVAYLTSEGLPFVIIF